MKYSYFPEYATEAQEIDLYLSFLSVFIYLSARVLVVALGIFIIFM